jgi:hypothetical protein
MAVSRNDVEELCCLLADSFHAICISQRFIVSKSHYFPEIHLIFALRFLHQRITHHYYFHSFIVKLSTVLLLPVTFMKLYSRRFSAWLIYVLYHCHYSDTSFSMWLVFNIVLVKPVFLSDQALTNISIMSFSLNNLMFLPIVIIQLALQLKVFNTQPFNIVDLEIQVDSEGFWRWCVALRITRFLDCVHRPVIGNTAFRKLDQWTGKQRSQSKKHHKRTT